MLLYPSWCGSLDMREIGLLGFEGMYNHDYYESYFAAQQIVLSGWTIITHDNPNSTLANHS